MEGRKVVDVQIIIQAKIDAVYEDEINKKTIKELLARYGPNVLKNLNVLFVTKDETQ